MFEAEAADAALLRAFPGMGPALGRLRNEALRRRPGLDCFPAHSQPLERWLRDKLAREPGAEASPVSTWDLLVAEVVNRCGSGKTMRAALFKDW